MKEIPLTRGLKATVDDEDFIRFGHLKWYAQKTQDGRFYAARRIDGKISLLHRAILGTALGKKVDHRNGNTLDCRRKNLRPATDAQNAQNSRKTPRPRSSIYKGVCRVSPRVNKLNPWLAYIGGAVGVSVTKRKYLGYFSNERAAARAYDRAARELFGSFASLNFTQS